MSPWSNVRRIGEKLKHSDAVMERTQLDTRTNLGARRLRAFTPLQLWHRI